MTYDKATKLRNEDAVICKKTGKVLYVLYTELYEKTKSVFVYCNDGHSYHHKEIK